MKKQKTIEKLLSDVEISLQRCREILEKILDELKRLFENFPQKKPFSGQMVLYEMDLKEELAYLFLLYDIQPILDRFLQRAYKKRPSDHTEIFFEKFSHMLSIVLSYQEQFAMKKKRSLFPLSKKIESSTQGSKKIKKS